MDNEQLNELVSINVHAWAYSTLEAIFELTKDKHPEYSQFNLVINVLDVCLAHMIKGLPDELRDTFLNFNMKNLTQNLEHIRKEESNG